MKRVAVVAHRGKSLGGGLDELRQLLAHEGIRPEWYEVAKSKKAPACARRAVDGGAEVLFVWGGDGMVQRCVDAVAGRTVAIAILPAGTANLLATNLGIPRDLPAAVEIGLRGGRKKLDLGTVNGEHFAVMAGAGFDALMIRDADKKLKGRVGKAAYVWTGARHMRTERVPTRVDVDGATWFDGKATCVLVGNVGTIMGGLTPFPEAEPDDGVLEVGVVTAKGPLQWSRVFGRMTVGSAKRSKFVNVTAGMELDVRLGRRLPYELDGGARDPVKRLRVKVEPAAVTMCVPGDGTP